MLHRVMIAACAVAMFCVASSFSQIASFEPIPLPAGVTEMHANGISSDATTVVGTLRMTDPISMQLVRRPFMWTHASGVQLLEVPETPPGYVGPPIEGEAFACSGNGSVVVGWSTTEAGSTGRSASKWFGAMRDLLQQRWAYAEAADVSDDGGVTIGSDSVSLDNDHPSTGAVCPNACGAGCDFPCGAAVAWTPTVRYEIMSRPWGTFEMQGISRSGQHLVGWNYDGSLRRWLVLPDRVELLPQSNEIGFGKCVSNNGTAAGKGNAVGAPEYRFYCELQRRFDATRWPQAGNAIQLATPRRWATSQVIDCSVDGKVFVGDCRFDVIGAPECPEPPTAMRWEPGFTAQPIKETLLAREVPGMMDWNLSSATGISANGTVIVGYGTFGQDPTIRAWIATLPTSCVADVDDGSGTGTPDGGVTIDDLLYFLARFESGC